MRSSFDRAMILKRLALSLVIVSCAGINLEVHSQPEILIAQGDASLPPPDPNYRPKSRYDAGAQGAGSWNAGNGAGTGHGDLSAEVLMRRRMRRRMKAVEGNADGVGGANGGNLTTNGGAGFNGVAVGAGSGFNGAGSTLGGPGAVPNNSGAGLNGPGAGFGANNSFGGGRGANFAARNRFKNGFGGAGANGGGGGGLFGRKALDLTSLSLSPDQKQRIQEMRSQVAPKTRELRKQLFAKRAELRDMMFEASAGDDQVRAKRKEVRQLQDKIEDLQLNDFLSIRSVLTPDQRLKLTDLKPGNKVAAGGGTQMVAPVVSTP